MKTYYVYEFEFMGFVEQVAFSKKLSKREEFEELESWKYWLITTEIGSVKFVGTEEDEEHHS